MNKTIILRLFLVIVVIYFTGMLLNNDWIQCITKPLIVTSLLVYFLVATQGNSSIIKKWFGAALVFSIAGDTLLMFSNSNELYFLLGLSSFLLAHIFYIISFHKIRIKESIEGRWYVAIIVAAYYLLIITTLMPHLDAMKIPVLIYGLVISFMLFVATHLYELKDNLTGRFFLTGAIFFVISDSVLAINKFYYPFALGGWVIMITYIVAQYMLTRGVIRYLTSVNK